MKFTLTFLITFLFIVICVHACKHDSECGHGFCTEENTCKCERAYFGKECVPWEVYFKNSKPTYIIICLVKLWGLGFSIWKFIEFGRTKHFLWKILHRFNARHAALVLSTIASLVHVVYFFGALDWNWKRQEEISFKMLFFIFYPCVSTAWICEMLVWMELNSASTLQNVETLPKYRKLFMVLNSIIFILQIGLGLASAVVSSHFSDAVRFIWICSILFTAVAQIGAFIFIGVIVLRKLNNSTSLAGSNQKSKMKIVLGCIIGVGIFCIVVGVGLFIATDPWVYFVFMFLSRLLETTVVTLLLATIHPSPPAITPSATIETRSRSSSLSKTIFADDVQDTYNLSSSSMISISTITRTSTEATLATEGTEV